MGRTSRLGERYKTKVGKLCGKTNSLVKGLGRRRIAAGCIKQWTGFQFFEDIVLMICECARRDSRRNMIGLCCVRELQLFEAVSKCRTFPTPGMSLRLSLWIFPISGRESCELARMDTRIIVPNSPLDRVEDPRSIPQQEGQ